MRKQQWKLKIVSGKFQNSGKFQKNAINDVKQISLSHVIICDNSSYGSNGVNLPRMLLTLEHHREGSENALNSRKYILEYSILC